MKRYVTRPAGWSPDPESEWLRSDSSSPDRSISAIERDDAPRNTGLLDASGTPLYAVEKRQAAAFVRFKG